MLVNRLVTSFYSVKKPDIGKKKPDGRQENSESTQAALRAAGRRLFGQLGYEGSSVGALCAEAKVTSGALYHHFGDKKGLFAAVAEELDSTLVALAHTAGTRALATCGDPWAAFLASVDALLEAGMDPAGRRIGLVDAPAVLGGEAWLAIRERHGLGAMIGTVQALQTAGILAAGEPRALARIILGLLYGAIEALPRQARGSDGALAASKTVVHAMLGGLRHAGRVAGPREG